MLYLITRTDEVDYDEYDSFVVRADTPDKALKICREKRRQWESPNDDNFRKDNTIISPIKISGKNEIILGSFNAG